MLKIHHTIAAFLITLAAVTAPASVAQAQTATSAEPTAGPVRLRQSAPQQEPLSPINTVAAKPAGRPGEFEAFVQTPRFGSDVINELVTGATDYSPVVPPDYVLQNGDEVVLTIWGAVEADLTLAIDRSGRIAIPRVGPVQVAGLRYSELQDAITRRVGQVFKNFQLSASLGRLRGVRVYLTGFVERPGSYVVTGLSTMANAVMRAGGPAAAGSFRDVQLRRKGKVVVHLDMYDLLARGDRSNDVLLQPDDVIHIPAAGPVVAVVGSVNRSAVFEVMPGESVQDVLRWAGGLSPVADRSRLALERLDQRNDRRIQQLKLPQDERAPLANGDVLRAFSAVSAMLSVSRQNKRVRVEGEVANPGEYLMPPDSTLQDAVAAAGGLSANAFLFGTEFMRESVRQTQQTNYERALRDLESDIVRSTASQRIGAPEDAAVMAAQNAASARLVERLRAIKSTGRIVLQLMPNATTLPDLMTEDNDRLYIPPRPSTVGVFGSVFNGGSYLYANGKTIADYLKLAGGPTKGAAMDSAFVIRANGTVLSAQQSSSNRWFAADAFASASAEAGDTAFVPEELNKTSFLQHAKDWTQVFYQFGLGVAGLKILGF